MPFSVNLEHFRIFERTDDVSIRPITLLTGGNSAGKSSFLAAIRYLADINTFGSSGPSFNKDPFLLGSFEQISHYRGGKAGRSKTFSLGFKGSVRNEFARGSRRLEIISEFSLKYAKRLSQPTIQSAKIKMGEDEIEFSYTQDWRQMRLIGLLQGNKISQILESNSNFSPELVTADPANIIYLLRSSVFSPEGDITDRDTVLRLSQLTQNLRSTLSAVPRTSYVGAPVRSRPLRTYDPIDTSPHAEGSHVPSQMAQLARTNPSEWENIRKSLVKFGKSSSLFADIEVRSLGRSDSDPFQLNVVIGGPKRNIMDVGYGVSQAIPIVYELLRRQRDTLYIAQQPEVHLHPEAQAALGTLIVEEASRLDGYIIIETHSDFLIDRIRRHVREQKILPNEVSILYFSREGFVANITDIPLGPRGNIESTPGGYRDFFLREELDNLGF